MQIIGFTSGYFDIMHPGHAMMLEECKQHCEHLIVGVNEYKTKTLQPDGRTKNEPVWTPEERLFMVKANKFVDDAFLYDGEPALYEYLSNNVGFINVRILGADHKGKPFTGDDLPIAIVFNSRYHDYSTTNTIAKIVKERG